MAGGFMAGFGSAFSQTFAQGNAARLQREEDAFRLGYQDYISQRDKREERKREDSKRLKSAETIAKAYSTPENTMVVYDMLLSMDESTVIKTLQDNDIQIQANPENKDGSGPADPRDALPAQAGSAVDAQMQQSGMQPPADKGIFGIGGTDKQQRRTDRTNNRIAETAGVSAQEVSDTRGWSGADPVPNQTDLQFKLTPKASTDRPDMGKISNVNEAIVAADWYARNGSPEEQEQAQALLIALRDQEIRKSRQTQLDNGTFYSAARGVGTNADGTTQMVDVDWDGIDPVYSDKATGAPFKGQVRLFNKNEEKHIDDIVKQYSEPTMKYNQRLAATKDAIKTVDDLATLQKEYPDAATFAGSIAQIADKTVRGTLGTINMISQGWNNTGMVVAPGQTPEQSAGVLKKIMEAEKALEGSMSGMTDTVSKNAIAAAMMDIKATKIAYAMAAQMGQTGAQVSVKEFQAMKDSAMGHGNPGASQVAASDFVASELNSLKGDYGVLGNIPEAQAFKEKYGVDMPLPKVQDPESFLKSDPATAARLDRILNSKKPDPTTQAKQPVNEAPNIFSDEDKKLYPALSPRGQELLKKRYGIK